MRSELKEGLSFDDGEIFGEGVEGVDEETAGGVFDLHEADGDRRPACGRGELVSDEGSMRVVEEFLMEVEEDFRLELFELEADMVFEAGFEADGFLLVAFEFLAVEFFAEGEGGFAGGGDFADEVFVAAKGDDVAGVADLKPGGIGFVMDFGLSAGVKEFRMNRSSEDLEGEFGHFRSDITDIHTRRPLKITERRRVPNAAETWPCRVRSQSLKPEEDHPKDIRFPARLDRLYRRQDRVTKREIWKDFFALA